MIDLSGKAAVVTGGAQGIGRAISIKLAMQGADVVIADMDENQTMEAVKEIKSLGHNAIPFTANITQVDQVQDLIKKCVDEFGSIDILVNNAGITKDTVLVRMKKEQWDQVLDVNLTGTFLCTQAAFKYMMKQRSGSIVNIASIAGERGNYGQANYAASKAGVIGFTKSIAMEGAGRSIRCNAIAPGLIETRMTEAIPEKIRTEMVSEIPLGAMGKPEDVANGVAFLCSPEASYITGIVLDINGGIHLK